MAFARCKILEHRHRAYLRLRQPAMKHLLFAAILLLAIANAFAEDCSSMSGDCHIGSALRTNSFVTRAEYVIAHGSKNQQYVAQKALTACKADASGLCHGDPVKAEKLLKQAQKR